MIITSEESYKRMLACQPGDTFHEMFTFVVRVRSIHNGIVITEHTGCGPIQKKLIFSSRQELADNYAYSSESMKHKSTLRWVPEGFRYQGERECVCEPVSLLNNGCRCV